MKKFVAGILAGVILTTGTFAFAETKQTIEAVFGRVKLVVDGKPVDKETLFYNDTTYVPLRAAAEVFDAEIGWDGATNTASLTSKAAASNKYYPKTDNVPNFIYVTNIPQDSEFKTEYTDGSGAVFKYSSNYLTSSDVKIYMRELENEGWIDDGTGALVGTTYRFRKNDKTVRLSIENNVVTISAPYIKQ